MKRIYSKPALDLTPSAACPIGKTPPGMACSMPHMVTYLLRGALVHHGLSDADSKRVAVTADVADIGGGALFEVRVMDHHGQQRQVLRIEDEAHLNQVVNQATTCGYLVADIKRILED